MRTDCGRCNDVAVYPGVKCRSQLPACVYVLTGPESGQTDNVS